MIRPRTGLTAPSQTTLRYLRQLVFPPSGIENASSTQCLRAPAGNGQRHFSSKNNKVRPAKPSVVPNSDESSLKDAPPSSTSPDTPRRNKAATTSTSDPAAPRRKKPKGPGRPTVDEFLKETQDQILLVPPASDKGVDFTALPPNHPEGQGKGDGTVGDSAEVLLDVEEPTTTTVTTPKGKPTASDSEKRRQISLKGRLPHKESERWFREFCSVLKKRDIAGCKEMFFEARKNNIGEFHVQSAGNKLMDVCNKLSKHAEAPAIFSHLAIYHEFLATASFNMVLEALLIRKNYNLFVRTFQHYTKIPNSSLKPDHKTYELFIKCLAAVGDVTKLKTVMHALEEQRKPITLSSFAVYLAGVRDRHGSLEELEREFIWIQSRKRAKQPALYNIMIEEALAYGKHSDAKRFVDQMKANGVEPDERTWAAFVKTQARMADWEAVASALKNLGEKGIKFSHRTLNALLDIYTNAADDLTAVEKFFDALCQEEGFPSLGSYNIMIRANLSALNEAGSLKWAAYLRQAGHEPTAVTFNTFFQDMRLKHVPKALMYRVYNTVYNRDKNKVDEVTRNILYRHTFPQEKTIAAPPLSLADVTSVEMIDIQQTAKKMEVATRHQDSRLAISTFREASVYIPITRETIKPLCDAYISIPDTQIDLPEAMPKSHIRREQIRDGVLGLMVLNAKQEAEKTPVVHPIILRIIHGAYKFMEANSIPISHTITNTVAATLINYHDAVGALHIMNEVSKTRWGRQTGWYPDSLTVLLRAYLVMQDIRGIRWVVDRLMETQKEPDQRFMEYLRRGMKGPGSGNFKEDLEQVIQQTKDYKLKLWLTIHRKAENVVQTMDADLGGTKPVDYPGYFGDPDRTTVSQEAIEKWKQRKRDVRISRRMSMERKLGYGQLKEKIGAVEEVLLDKDRPIPNGGWEAEAEEERKVRQAEKDRKRWEEARREPQWLEEAGTHNRGRRIGPADARKPRGMIRRPSRPGGSGSSAPN
jgi:pentatricopeptide repeat protein